MKIVLCVIAVMALAVMFGEDKQAGAAPGCAGSFQASCAGSVQSSCAGSMSSKLVRRTPVRDMFAARRATRLERINARGAALSCSGN